MIYHLQQSFVYLRLNQYCKKVKEYGLFGVPIPEFSKEAFREGLAEKTGRGIGRIFEGSIVYV